MPSPGSYILYNPAYSTFAGVADNNATAVGYTSLDKAQLWELGADNRIGTVLRNGQTKYMTHTGADITLTDAGFAWSIGNISANMWRIQHPSNPTYYSIIATNVSGTPHNATLSNPYGAHTGNNSHWLFLPFSGWRGPRLWNQAVSPEDLFSTSSETLKKIVQDMLVAFRANLNKSKKPTSMIPTHVTRIPSGSETGSFLALTLTDKLTVSYFELDGASDVSTSQQKSFNLTPSQLGGSAADLFKYIAECVKKAVVTDWNLSSTEHDPLIMGMTVAFPVEKTTLDSGKLLRWTKDVTDNVTSGGAIGLDIVEELQKALNKIGLHIKCNALLNDTTATLLAQAYESGGCSIAAIFDSGTNAAYIEAAAKVKSLDEADGEMVLNTEWGSFGNVANLQQTQFDCQIDRESARPGEQIFEKLVSSTSVGELIRLVLLYYIDIGISASPTPYRPLFNRRSSAKFNAKGSITIDLVWEIDAAKTNAAVQQLLVKKLGLPQTDVTEEDGKRVKDICRALLLRTARLSACAMAAILILMERAQIGGGIELGARIGMSGSLARPTFRRDMEDALRDIIGANATKNVLIALIKRDRTNLGAAVCAWLASTNGSD